MVDKQNNARYDSFYVTLMLNMETTYSGLKTLLTVKKISFEGQDRYPLRSLVDQRGEQTINKDANTAGYLFLSIY